MFHKALDMAQEGDIIVMLRILEQYWLREGKRLHEIIDGVQP